MAFSHIIDGLCYHFADLKDTPAKATPLSTGRVTIAAGSQQPATKEPVTKVLR